MYNSAVTVNNVIFTHLLSPFSNELLFWFYAYLYTASLFILCVLRKMISFTIYKNFITRNQSFSSKYHEMLLCEISLFRFIIRLKIRKPNFLEENIFCYCLIVLVFEDCQFKTAFRIENFCNIRYVPGAV